MRHTELRQRGRAMLAANECISPASVYDSLSARCAALAGFELGLLSGSIASASTLPAPDLVVITLTEFADLVRRVVRAGDLTLMVDADHGYGNALNVMRTIEETEHAGVSIVAIEDLELPTPFGADADACVSIEEMTGKLRAALAARSDPSLVIAARCAAPGIEGTEATVARAKAYAATGVDALFIVNFEDFAVVEAVHAAVKLPIITGSAGGGVDRKRLRDAGVRIALQGHQPIAATVKALSDTYAHLRKGGSPSDLKPRIASADEMARVTGAADYERAQRDYLGIGAR